MEFKTLKNIESSFRHLRLFSMLFLGACTLISVAAVWTSYRFAEAQRQKIVRESNVTERTLVTTCRLRNAVRSDNNPQGFLIEDLRILENKDLGSYER